MSTFSVLRWSPDLGLLFLLFGRIIRYASAQILSVFTLSYFLIAFALLTVPGMLLLKVFNIKEHKALFAVALSYGFYIAIASVSKLATLTLDVTLTIYLVAVVVITVLSSIRSTSTLFDRTWFKSHHNGYWFAGLSITALSYLVYRAWAGPYIEMPADLFNHLQYAQNEFSRIDKGFLGTSTDLSGLLKQKASIWYSLYSVVTTYSGLNALDSVGPATLLNGLLFLCLSYCFAWVVLEPLRFSPKQHLSACLASTLLLFLHMGTDVFAYVRYYTLAPSILNFVFYYVGIILVMRLIAGSSSLIKDSVLLTFFMLCAAIIHTQEALYVAVMGSLILGWAVFVQPFTNQAQYQIGSKWQHWRRSTSMLQLGILGAILLGFLVMQAISYVTLDRPTDLANKVIQLSEQGPILNRILLLNPSFQFASVITVWGALVYLLFISFHRRLIQSPYLYMGMFVPLFTVFNPLFVDWFLRLEGVHTLWRLLYIVPLNLVAGATLIYLIEQVTTGKLWQKAGSLIAILLMVMLLFPPVIANFGNANSRLTLDKVETENAYTQWLDLLHYLAESQDKPKIVLTDPITGYAISAFTDHYTYNYKFLASQSYAAKRFNFKDYTNKPLARYKNALIVINERDGAYSQTGELARHWPADILQVSGYYSPALKPHLESNPDRFEKLWSADKIAVFSIK